jgi:hypothetical protein
MSEARCAVDPTAPGFALEVKHWGLVSVLLMACGQSPAPPAANPTPASVSSSREAPDAASPLAEGPDAGAPRLGAKLEPLTIDDSLPANDALFQFHVETLTRNLPESSALRGNFASIRKDSMRLAGRWPEAAWAIVFHPNWKLPDRGTARLYRWIKGRWDEVPAGKKNDASDFAIDAWTQGRVVILRADPKSGNIPQLMAISQIGTLVTPAPATPQSFIGHGVESAPTGELFARGYRPRVKDQSRPAIAIWNADASNVTVHDLPSAHPIVDGVWTSTVVVNQVCVLSATNAIAFGEEQATSDPNPVLTIWRWDGTSMRRETPAGTAKLWGSGCTPDGALWIGNGDTLLRQTPSGDNKTYSVPGGLELVTTNRGDVFVRRTNGWYVKRS